MAIRRMDNLGRPVGIGATGTHQNISGAEQVSSLEGLTGAVLVFKLGCHCFFDLLPGQPTCQNCQGIVQFDHDINVVAEEVDCLHTKISHKASLPLTFSEGFGARNSWVQSRQHLLLQRRGYGESKFFKYDY